MKKNLLKFVYKISKIFLKALLRIELSGAENIPKSGPAIIVANHQSYLDIPVIALAFYHNLINLTWVVSKANAESPVLKPLWLFYKKISTGGGAIDNAKAELKSNRFVVIFPEGSRRWCLAKGIDKKVGNGAAVLALSTAAPIIPIGLYGTDKVLPPDASKFDRTQQIKATIGKPFSYEKIDTQSIDPAVLERSTDQIMSRIAELVERSRPIFNVHFRVIRSMAPLGDLGVILGFKSADSYAMNY